MNETIINIAVLAALCALALVATTSALRKTGPDPASIEIPVDQDTE
jgi:hypothetical protein